MSATTSTAAGTSTTQPSAFSTCASTPRRGVDSRVGALRERVVVLGIPGLAEGASSKAVPVNLTLIPAGRFVYGTRGTDKCILDDVRQSPLPAAGSNRQWQVEARGFCLEPARAVGGDDAILVTTFELTGLLTWDSDQSPTH